METPVRSLSWEYSPREKGMAPHSRGLCLETHDRGVWQAKWEYGALTGLRDRDFHFSSCWLCYTVFNTEKTAYKSWTIKVGLLLWRMQTASDNGDSVLCTKWRISHSSLLSSALSVSFYKQHSVQSMYLHQTWRGLAWALTSGRTISDSSVAVPLCEIEDQWGHPPQRFVWMMEGIKLRKALAEIIVSKKMAFVAFTTHATAAGAFKSTTRNRHAILFIPGLFK